MFALIVTLISVALVALLALVSVYYIGPAVNEGHDRATISRYLSEGTQIQGALELYRADTGSLPTGTNDQIKQTLLDNHYLKSWPEGTWELRNDFAVRTDLSAATCLEINKKMNVNVIPSCTDSQYSGRSLCCQTL